MRNARRFDKTRLLSGITALPRQEMTAGGLTAALRSGKVQYGQWFFVAAVS